MIKLYVFLGSPRAFNVMAVASHLGIEYQTQALNPVKGEHLAPAYAAINPNKRIPGRRRICAMGGQFDYAISRVEEA